MSNLVPIQNSLKMILKDIETNKTEYCNIPEEYRDNLDVVRLQRKLKLRHTDTRGYDIITKTFFVNEKMTRKNIFFNGISYFDKSSCFESFEEYYSFLDGDIYKNSCYYGYDFSEDIIKKYSIDMNKINKTSLIKKKISAFTFVPNQEDKRNYNESEKKKNQLKKWISKLNSCENYKDFKKIINQAEHSAFAHLYINLLLQNYISQKSDKTFSIIMEYLSKGSGYETILVPMLCTIYKPDDVLQHYHYTYGAKSTIREHKKRTEAYVNSIRDNKINYKSQCLFDEDTHFYILKTVGVSKDESCYNFLICYYFETFEDLIKVSNGNLCNCDLSKAPLHDYDFSKYKTNEFSKLPYSSSLNPNYSLLKKYSKKSKGFDITQVWSDQNGKEIKKYKHHFNYFFDFVYFLDGDLSNSDLLFCDGLDNLKNIEKINLTGAFLKSTTCKSLSLPFKSLTLSSKYIESFEIPSEFEKQTMDMLQYTREEFEDYNDKKIYYISDLHLMHRIINAGAISYADIIYILQTLIDQLIEDLSRSDYKNIFQHKKILLIGGDVSSDFNVFQIFVKLLRKSISKDCKVIFVLGNHELWQFKDLTFNESVEIYKNFLLENQMYLLQNNIIFLKDNEINYISEEDIPKLSKEKIRQILVDARTVIFGGLGFSGCNSTFNATNGIYRESITRKQEIEESQKINNLYLKICDDLSDRKVIIFTHTPKNDWNNDNVFQDGFVYVSGHSHRNYFYDDSHKRIYSDNQIGYHRENFHLKYFYIDDNYDIFIDYPDGIYKITREEYSDFYSGKKIGAYFSRDFKNLYMLKKSGYYCFIRENNKNILSMLNGGNMKNLDVKDINYYYENMDEVISYIKSPLDKYTKIQKEISELVKRIGGDGRIHGCIIDIDFFNHIYVNPSDLTVTGYWASDIINKLIYPSIPNLLKNRCPELYANYNNYLSEGKKSLILKSPDEISSINNATLYLSTDIYKNSREISKMQKLEYNVLTTWHEPNRYELNS